MSEFRKQAVRDVNDACDKLIEEHEWTPSVALHWYSVSQQERVLAQDKRIAELEAENAKLREALDPKQELYEEGRCQVCGWPLAKTWEGGCVPESCAMRPREGSEEWFKLKERRRWLEGRAFLAAPETEGK